MLASLVWLFSTLASNALVNFTDAANWEKALSFVAFASGLLVASFGLFSMRSKVFDFTLTQSRGADAPKRPIVIMLLSHLTAVDEQIEKSIEKASQRGLTDNCLPGAPGFSGADNALQSWQQNLRVLKHNFVGPKAPTRTGRVVVIPSRESVTQFEGFRRLAEACLTKEGLRERVEIKEARIPPWLYEKGKPASVDYHDLKALGAAMRAAVADEQRARRERVSHREICIDATPGMKVTSIAAAAATFGTEILFSYVGTAPPGSTEEPEINVFDVRTALRARGD
jgi:hypothetical protein